MKRKTIYSVLGGMAAIVLSLIAVGEYFLYFALDHTDRHYTHQEGFEWQLEHCPWMQQWVDSIRQPGVLRDTFVINRDGAKLHAFYLPSTQKTQKTAVIVHGYKDNATGICEIGYLYQHDLGWNILIPDNYAHGLSEGHQIGMGWKDRLDVLQWTRVAHELYQTDTLVVHGISMGAATTMGVSGEETPDYIRAFVEDCGYTSVWDEFAGELKKQFGLPTFPLLHVSSLLCKLQRGWSFQEASPLNQVRKCQKPMLFIHGDADDFVPTWMVHPLYLAKPGTKELYLAPGSAHAESYWDHHEEYTAKVRRFLLRWL